MALGLPVERPSEGVEERLLAYNDQLKDDLELLEKFDPGTIIEAHRQPVVLERAYIETPTTCDTFVTRGVLSQQPQAQPTLAAVASLEVTTERWETTA